MLKIRALYILYYWSLYLNAEMEVRTAIKPNKQIHNVNVIAIEYNIVYSDIDNTAQYIL